MAWNVAHDYVQNELMQLPVGKIGKMRVHESGRISLDINGYVVDMNVSIPLRYQQQVATIDQQQVNILGEVTHRLVLTPNMQNYLWDVCLNRVERNWCLERRYFVRE